MIFNKYFAVLAILVLCALIQQDVEARYEHHRKHPKHIMGDKDYEYRHHKRKHFKVYQDYDSKDPYRKHYNSKPNMLEEGLNEMQKETTDVPVLGHIVNAAKSLYGAVSDIANIIP